MAAIVVAAAGSLWLAGHRPAPDRPDSGHPAQGLSADDAHSMAVGLGDAGRHQASLPYFRRVISVAPDDFSAHQNYSTALANAAQESRYHLGRLETATRSSLERVAMLKASLFESDESESLSRTPEDLAVVISQRGQTLRTWGFPIEALAEYRRALALTPGDAELARVTRTLAKAVEAGGAP